MDSNEPEDTSGLANVADVGVNCQSAVNSLVLDYYKKFGRKRDLEQYFSLTTAQGDLRDPSGLFWRKMKSENDSSGSEGRKSESSQEVCRISIRCSVPEPCSSQDENSHTKTESDSPPIIIEYIGAAGANVDTSRHTDEESIKSDDNNSHRSFDVLLDTSLKPLSPTSSITSQRKLEWDSLADVGYANESERKNSASNLSTLERLALKQQYSNNDTKRDIGPPTSHSTPIDENENKNTKCLAKKTTRFYKKDMDFVEVNVPHSSDMNPTQSINVNLTKHISFNVEKDGGVTIDNIRKDISVSPEKKTAQAVVPPQIKIDKEIQTSLTKTKDKSTTPANSPKPIGLDNQKNPVMISLNTLRKRIRRKKSKGVRRRLRPKTKAIKDEIIPQEKSAQLSEAESFEYMPGHIYNQNLKSNEERPANNTSAGNKSSLESSAGVTDSSKGSSHSFTKDLEKSIEILRLTLQKRFNDSDVKNKLIKEVVSRLLSSRYRDDDSTAAFLSGLTFSSRRIGLKDNHTTTSTSDTNNTEVSKPKRPKKSILRPDKFNPNVVASTSQSAPNLLSVASSEKTIPSNLIKITRTTDSDVLSKKSSSDNAFPKTSSEQLYIKYLEAVKREEAYKKHLRDKEKFLKQKLVSSDTIFKIPVRLEADVNNRLKDLMKDLTRNNYDDGSGDASKLEGGSNSVDFERYNAVRNQINHSVFTLSSSHSECQGKKPNLKKKQCDVRDLNEAGPSKHYCCCPQHYTKSKIGYTDSSVQVNIKCQYEDTEGSENPKLSALECHKSRESPPNMGHVISDDAGVIKYVCLCNEKPSAARDMGDNFLIYKCSRLTNCGIQLGSTPSKISNTGIQCGGESCTIKQDDIKLIRTPCKMTDDESSSSDNIPCVRKQSKSSQTNLLVKMMYEKPAGTMNLISDNKTSKGDPSTSTKCVEGSDFFNKSIIHEATRCLQTEISINPKISDPSLTDINLVNDCECAELVDEKFREVSKTCSKKSDSVRKAIVCSDMCASSESGKNSVKNQDLVKGITCCDNTKEFEQSSSACAQMAKDDYQIPIQGTNMTLMVTLGSHEVKDNLEKVNQACVTDKTSIVEQATCITEECSKSVQCQCSNVATIKKTDCSSVDHKSNKLNRETGTQSGNCRIEQPIKACVPETPKCNTYPKKVQIKKPLLRSNTDTGKIEKSCCVQTDFSSKIDYKTQRVAHADQNTCIATKKYESDNECGRKCNIEKGIIIKSPRSECGDSTAEVCRKKDIDIQNDSPRQPKQVKQGCSAKNSKCVGCETETMIENESCHTKEKTQTTNKLKVSPNCSSDSESTHKSVCCDQPKGSTSSNVQNICCTDTDVDTIKDPILNMIKDITKQYSKNDIEKMKRKRCFKEIMTVLNYLLETDESTDPEKPSGTDTNSCCDNKKPQEKVPEDCYCPKQSEKSPQVTNTCKNNKATTESSVVPTSSDLPTTSSDSATCKVLNKIKKECEKYYQKRCKAGRKCEASSSTSANCDQCKKVHHCACRSHKCRRSKTGVEKFQKKCVAYNLIIQTSESVISEEAPCDKKCRPLQNIVVKVPKRRPVENVCKETSCKKETVYKVEKPRCSPRCTSKNRSRSCPNESEMSSTEEIVKKTQQCTVREYLEKNRPDFVENCSQRQNCMKYVSDIRNQDGCSSPRLKMVVVHNPNCMGNMGTNTMYCGGVPICYNPCNPCDACNGCNPCNICSNQCNQCVDPTELARIANERAAQRDMLSLHVGGQADLTALTADQLRRLAADIGIDLRRNKPAPKFISEKEMKKHSEKIYKTLPEVVQKKEEQKKMNIKKTNLLMAYIFNKNLQKKTLRGSVNLSNYNAVINI